MDRGSRPVIVARYIIEDHGSYLETSTKQLVVADDAKRLVAHLMRHSNGRATVTEMTTEEFSESRILGFLSVLEASSGCFEAHLLAQFGHLSAQFPDPLRVYPGDAFSIQLMTLPLDRDGEFFGADDRDQAIPALNRRTTREFLDSPVSLSEIIQIASAAYGVIGAGDGFQRRTVPSAGALFPLQLDYLVLRSDELEPGIYRWAKQRNGLIRYAAIDPELVGAAFLSNDWQRVALVQVISYDNARGYQKYASRAHRFGLIEAGHAAQNAMLAARSLALGVWEFGGYADLALSRLLEVDPHSGGIATVVFYGKERPCTG